MGFVVDVYAWLAIEVPNTLSTRRYNRYLVYGN